MNSLETRVLYADEALIVLEKPAGLLCVPGRGEDKQDCLSARAQRLYPQARVVHRLDMATSGLMLMALTATAQRSLNDAFANRTVVKRYTAVVDGLLTQTSSPWETINLPIALDWPNRPCRVIDPLLGKPSVTQWRVLSHDPASQTTRLELAPVTGRSHQLRVHLKALGHPILGDSLYACPRVQGLAQRLLLHASHLEFTHPMDPRMLRFTSSATF